MKMSDYAWVINWICRSFDSLEPTAIRFFETFYPKIVKYGKIFRILNCLTDCPNISKIDFTSKCWQFDYSANDDLIEVLKKYEYIQISSDELVIQFKKDVNPILLFNKILDNFEFGEFSPIELISLNIFKNLQKNRFIEKETLFNGFQTGKKFTVEQLNKYLKNLTDYNLIDEVINTDGKCYLVSPISSYGDFEKAVELCKKESSESLDKIGESLEYIDKRVGIPDSTIPVRLQEGINLCIQNGLIHRVSYNYGEPSNPKTIELLFPSSKKFSEIFSKAGDFDKYQASAGMMIYATKLADTKIKYLDKFVEKLTSEHIKVRTENDEIFRQYCPMIFAGMIEITEGQSEYRSPITSRYSTYSGLRPRLLNTEENRDIIKKTKDLINQNEDFSPSSIKTIDSSLIKYEDTAGGQRKINRKQKVFEIMLNKKFRKEI